MDRKHWWTNRTSLILLWSVLLGSGGANAQSANPSSGLELEDFVFWSEQCQALAQSRQYEKALEACNESIVLNDDLDETLEVWTTRGESLIYLGQYEDAFISLGQVLEEQPEYSLAITYRCMAQYNLGKFQDAVDTCEEALLIDGNWGKQSPSLAWYYRGLSLQKQGFLETALDSFERAIRLSARGEEAPPLAENDAGNQVSNSDTSDVLKEWLISNQPNNQSGGVGEPLAQAEWCNTLHLLGNKGKSVANQRLRPCGLDDAISLYEQALLTNPQDAVLWRQQGLALEQLGQYERALTVYWQALALNANHAPTSVRQCGVFNQLDRYEEALAACEIAMQAVQHQEPYDIAYQLNQHSIALLGLERYEEAVVSAERAISVEPNYAPAYNSKAVGLWQLEQTVVADQVIQEAIRRYGEQEIQFEDTFYRPNSDPWPLFYRDYGLAWFNYGRILATKGNPFSHIADYAYCQSLALPIQKLDYHLRRQSLGQASQAALSATCTDISQSDEQLANTLMSPVSSGQTLPILSPDRFLNTLLNLASIHIHTRPRSSFSYASMAIELAPESFVAWHNLGLAALKSGQSEEAYYAYSIAHRLEPENVQVLLGVGEVLIQQSETARKTGDMEKAVMKREEAIAIYEQILNVDPTYTAAETRLDALMGPEQQSEQNDTSEI